ncbi:MAG: DUF131 domain-containing protein [Crenarchaeota archaeon]|nr:DUF131 domain-containing protein [Thermoproteota archaeon]MDW8033805.1 DUF131 domain-containing protein [Nitrososphaerota archaeon]
MFQSLVLIGTSLILLGFLIVFLTIILSFLHNIRNRSGEVKSEKKEGAVVMIGPLPIVLASDPKTAKILIILAIVLTIILSLVTITLGLMKLGSA